VEDRCTIGNPDVDASDSERLVIEQYTFGMVTEQTCFHDTFDAIVGLAYPEFAEPGVEPLFDAMMAEGILGHDVFAFHMSMNPDDEESEVMFGDWNVDKIDPTYNDGTGELDWHPVEHFLFWSIALDDILIDGDSTGLCDDRDCLFTPDTGTSLLTFPSWAMNEYNAKYGFDIEEECESEFFYGNITYVINGIHYDLPSHHHMTRTIDYSSDKGGWCQS
jgi:hypothetical protein